MRFLSQWLPLAFIALNGCVHNSDMATENLSPTEVKVACDLTRHMTPNEFVSSWGQSQSDLEEADITFVMKELKMKPLPRKLKCGSTSHRLNTGDYGDRIESFGLSIDSSIAAVEGGFQYATLHGGGAVCYFRMHEGTWVRIGCQRTWDS